MKKTWVISYHQYGTDKKMPYHDGSSLQAVEFSHRYEAERVAKQLRAAGHKKVKVITIIKW